jgi:glutamate 5-kinase
VVGPDGTELGRGLTEYSDTDALRLRGCQSEQIEEILGYRGRSVVIHRDELVLFDSDS